MAPFMIVLLTCLSQPDVLKEKLVSKSKEDSSYFDAHADTLSTEINLSNWGNITPADIGLVQVSVSHQKNRNSIRIYVLSRKPDTPMTNLFRSKTPSYSGSSFLVTDFNSSSKNRLGGYFGNFFQPPSWASASVERLSGGTRALTLNFNKADNSFCGVWINLYETNASPSDRFYLNAESFSYLTFWIKGGTGREKIDLRIADARWNAKEDALSVGKVDSFLPSGKISTEWQQAVVPFDAFPSRISKKDLATVSFAALSQGRGRIGIKTLAFSENEKTLPPLYSTTRQIPQKKSVEKATWVWNTTEILEKERGNQLLRFLLNHDFNHVFLQLPKDFFLQPRFDQNLCSNIVSLKKLISAMKAKGIKVHALEGYEKYALPEWHPYVLEIVEKVINYNNSVNESERFYGIHFDIEPHLLPGFGGERREGIFYSYLSIIEKCAERIHQAGMIIGVDIPFWYDSVDELTRESMSLEFNNVNKYPSEHIIDMVDITVLMDYRTKESGANSIISNAENEIDYAAAKNKPVFIGLETNYLPNESIYTFKGFPQTGLPSPSSKLPIAVIAETSKKTMFYLLEKKSIASFSQQFQDNGMHDATLYYWPIERKAIIHGNELSFFDSDKNTMNKTMNRVSTEFSSKASFAGFSIHDLQGFLNLP